MRVPGFFGPLSTVAPDGVDRIRNLVREITGDKERPYRFIRRPGRRVFVAGLHGPVRGGAELNGAAYVVAGERLYQVAADRTATEIGAMAPDTRPAHVISSGSAGHQVAAVAGGKLYVLNTLTGSFAQVVDADLPGDIVGLAMTDLYAVAWFRDSRAIRISAINDFTQWAGGDVAERSQYVDHITMAIADQKELLLLGPQSNETWWHSGNPSFPYEPVPNALGLQGIAGSHAGCLVGDTPYWVGRSKDGAGPVFRIRGGYTPERISTHWVERRIQSLALISDAYAYSFEEGGHRFFVLTFPNADVTLVFDEAVEPAVAWAEWTYLDPLTGRSHADLGRCHLFAFDAHLVGSRRDGTVYEQSFAFHDDAGDAIECERTFRGPYNDGRPVFVTEARLGAEKGVGLLAGQGADPRVMLRKSRDDGRTWGPELTRSLGARGDYGHTTRWQRLGRAEMPAWRLRYTDPTITALTDFHIDAEGAAH